MADEPVNKSQPDETAGAAGAQAPVAKKTAAKKTAAKKTAASSDTKKTQSGARKRSGAKKTTAKAAAPEANETYVVQGNAFPHQPAPEGFEHTAFNPDNVQHIR